MFDRVNLIFFDNFLSQSDFQNYGRMSFEDQLTKFIISLGLYFCIYEKFRTR